MKRALVYGLLGIAIASCLLAPGVWWGDSLNAYIQGIIGMYSAGQPVLMALICTLSSHIMAGSLPIFVFCITLYFMGFALMVFAHVRHRIWAPVLFFSCSFYPLLFANIGVVQTEALQLAMLSLFIPLTIFLYRYEGRRRLLYFALLVILLCGFYLARYDAVLAAVILAYWLAYSYLRVHTRITIFITLGIVLLFYTSGSALDHVAGIGGDKSEMKLSILITDIAAISAESGTDYVPDYCWKPILPANERTVQKIQYGMVNWKSSFYSYIYNIDPSIGLFRLQVSQYQSDIINRWAKVVSSHPILYFKYHLKVFGYLLDGDNYDMGLWSGLILSHQNNSKLVIDRTDAVNQFLDRHGDKYVYRDGSLIYAKDDKPITKEEEQELFALAGPRRQSDVAWMKWYSQIPSRTYNRTNAISERYVLPLLDLFKKYFSWISSLLVYFLLLVFFLLFVRGRIVDSYYRLSFTLLCLAGVLHLALRLFIITDAVFRFGVISILLVFAAVIILVADRWRAGGGQAAIRGLTFIACGVLAFIIFLLIAQLSPLFHLDSLLAAEKTIFRNTVESNKWVMPRFYRVHTIVLYALALVGLVVMVSRFIVPAVRWLSVRLINAIRRNKQRAAKSLLVVGLTALIVTPLLVREYQLRRFCYNPGSCYPGNDFSPDSPTIAWELLADEKGMNYYNYDFFKDRKDTTQMIVNRQGFPSMFDYDRHTIDSLSGTGPGRKWKQLFLGDSYLGGIGASTYEHSFIEIYRRRNRDRVVCSTGIGGMDPVQYRLVAERFLPELMPDEVIVVFSGWSDIMYRDRRVVPYLPLLADIPKVGVIWNYIMPGVAPVDTLTLPPDQAYRLYRKRFSLMEETGFWPRLCRKSCLTTQLYYKFHPIQYYHVSHPMDSLATYRNLKVIKGLADSLGVKFTVLYMPTPDLKDYGPADYEEHFKWVFRDLWPYVHTCPRGTVTESDCSTSIDFHFNDTGQKKIADFLQKELVH